MDLSSLWWVFCAPVPLRMAILRILISTWLLAANFGPRPLYPVADSRAHVQDMITGVREPSFYNTACQGERCDPTCVRYTRDQLLAISPARLTPDLTSRLRKFDIGFCLPCKRSRRGGKNLKKGRPVDLITPCVLPVGPRTDLRMPSSGSPNSPYPTSALFGHFWTCSILVFVLSLSQNTCSHHK